ncbi:hypothetical protein [Pedobacter foliorum]|uniref:hypothetical protein n=1 Tax=Pedobacter foliorum TaxID=2739058 RepID=UPI0015649001|nr:hypothetical protein [Pedobacter foliorum]NRF40096.1 hypothetical protein [Pedobacter foliorum]
MRSFLFVLLILCYGNTPFRKQRNWAGTMVFTFKLPPPLSGNRFIKANVLYKGKLLSPKSRLIGGMKTNIQSSFSYSSGLTQKVGKVQIPVSIPPNVYAWLCDDDMLTEMVLYPERYKIQITNTANSSDFLYELPVSFDFIADNALNLAFLQNQPLKQRILLLLQKTWMLSLSLKDSGKKNKPAVTDTNLYYRLQKNDIPAGLKMKPYSNLYNDRSRAGQQFVITKAYLYKGKIFINRMLKNSHLLPRTDDCKGNFMGLDGEICASEGCITGYGAGKCAGMFLPGSNVKELEITVVIDP